jgi:hypothetical protein
MRADAAPNELDGRGMTITLGLAISLGGVGLPLLGHLADRFGLPTNASIAP